MSIKRFKRIKYRRKRPKDPYPIAQGWGFMVTPNFLDMLGDLSELYYELDNPAVKGNYDYTALSYQTDLGPVYALCENYIRFRTLAPESYKDELGFMPERATEHDVLLGISRIVHEPIDNWEFIEVLRETRKILRRYNRKYGNNKWRKDIKYVGTNSDPEHDVTNWKWVRKREHINSNSKRNKVQSKRKRK